MTGAPAIEGSTPNTTFESDAFFPQRLITPNYFGTLGAQRSYVADPHARRSTAPTPGGALHQHRSARTPTWTCGCSTAATDGQSLRGNQPSLAAAPSIGNVQGTVSNGVVTFSATVTGDPSAGVQEVWVTWTGTGRRLRPRRTGGPWT